MSTQPSDPNIIRKMNHSLIHRGPDGEGFYSETNAQASVQLGHRRLAILDLHTGQQPLSNEDQKIWVTFNGEIYNYRQLKGELQALGHVFKTQSDTEVLVHGYEQFGTELACHLDGMFAFAIWDSLLNQIYLARDISGKKPLYFADLAQAFIFSSEIKALFSSGLMKKNVEEETFLSFLYLGHSSGSQTLYSSINQLPAAHWAIKKMGQPLVVKRYWSWSDQKLKLSQGKYRGFNFKNEEHVQLELRKILGQAVQKRLQADVPVGAFLSGGIDSAIVAGLASKLMGARKLQTFTIGFEEDLDYDESIWAEQYSRRFETSHFGSRLSLNPESLVTEIVDIFDEPFADSSALASLALCKMTANKVKVALSGDGGDELFAGYRRFWALLKMSRVPKVPPFFRPISKMLLTLSNSQFDWAARLSRLFYYATIAPQNRQREWTAYISQTELVGLLNKPKSNIVSLFHSNVSAEGNDESCLNLLLKNNFENYLADDLNVKLDRTSMSASLEVRCPLLDKDLIEFSLLVPEKFKIKSQWGRPPVLKYILKNSFAEFFSEQDLIRGKKGFAVPLDYYFRGPLKSMTDHYLKNPNNKIYRYLDARSVNDLVFNHQNKNCNYGALLWTVLLSSVWLEKNF